MKVKRESEVNQSCPTLSDPMDCSLPGSSVHGILQARILEWGAIAFSRLIIANNFISLYAPGTSIVKYRHLLKAYYVGSSGLTVRRLR